MAEPLADKTEEASDNESGMTAMLEGLAAPFQSEITSPPPDADELSAVLEAHRMSLKYCLEDWSAQQERILSHALCPKVLSSEKLQCVEPVASRPSWDESMMVESAATRLERVLDELHSLKLVSRHQKNGSETQKSRSGPDVEPPSPRTARQPKEDDVRKESSRLSIASLPKRMMPTKEESHTLSDLSEIVYSSGQEKKDEDMAKKAQLLGFKRKSTDGLRKMFGRSSSALPPEKRIMRCITKCVMSSKFESICASVIMANAVMIGTSSNYAMEHLDHPEHATFSAFELGFYIFYVIELSLRFLVFGKGYFRDSGYKWNIFDLFLVLLSTYDNIEKVVSAQDDSEEKQGAAQNLSFLRMLRLMKMLKLLRMIRLMRMFRELRLILHSVLGCVKAMFWAIILIVTISYMFGICFLQACTTYLQGEENVSLQTLQGINEYWSSVNKAMLSLYMASTAGKEWSVIGAPLQDVGAGLYCLFLIYIAFFLFVVANTVTSLFIEATMANSALDQQMIIQLELERKDTYIDKLQVFYDELDENGDGEVSYEEFCGHVETPQMQAFASSLEIDTSDTKQFFCILSDHGKRTVDIETFVVGCIKLKGQAKSMDLMDLVYAHRQSSADLSQFRSQTSESMDMMTHKLEKLERTMHRQAGKCDTICKMEDSLDHTLDSVEHKLDMTGQRGFGMLPPAVSAGALALSCDSNLVTKQVHEL